MWQEKVNIELKFSFRVSNLKIRNYTLVSMYWRLEVCKNIKKIGSQSDNWEYLQVDID